MRTGKIAIVKLILLTLISYPLNLYADVDVGVYYFPGWLKSAPLKPADPWLKIKKYPDRKPLNGWYKDGDPHTTEQQTAWMHQAGINFVIYDWYWLEGHGVTLNQSIDAFKASNSKNGMEFSILWANHFNSPRSMKTFDAVVDYWVANYFSSPDYKRIDGRPVVFIFSPEELGRQAHKFGSSSRALIDRARKRAVASGFKGIYFVGASQASSGNLSAIIKDGYDALTAYNYHYGMSGKSDKFTQPSTSYQELTSGYEQSWRWIIDNTKIPYFVPVTSGWDKRPWGGSKTLSHDRSASTPEQFGHHVSAAKKLIESNHEKTLGHMVICCWNEYGEGSYIEPTEKYGTDYIRVLKQSLDQKD